MDDLKNQNNHGQSSAPENEIDIKELWRIIYSYKRVIAIIFVVVVSLTFYLTMTSRPIYEATTVVMIKQSGANPSSFVFDFGMNNSQQRLQNEIEVLNSYNLHDQVVQSLVEDKSAKEMSLFGTRYVRKRYRVLDNIFEWIGKGPDSLTTPDALNYSERIRIVERLRDNSSISTIREADVLKIAVISPDSSEAVFLANRISKDPDFIGADFCACLFDQSHPDKAYELGQPGFFAIDGEPNHYLCRTVRKLNSQITENARVGHDDTAAEALDQKFHKVLQRYREVIKDRRDLLLKHAANVYP